MNGQLFHNRYYIRAFPSIILLHLKKTINRGRFVGRTTSEPFCRPLIGQRLSFREECLYFQKKSGIPAAAFRLNCLLAAGFNQATPTPE
ncbi:hypothetical protein ACFOQM_05040 [Paenibacillus sp. GCM10012307]|uniref:hypothetical protein n=1 Tax=Paenibacillus sp. GCM10012307 TaxID=3317343 RepID=UPI00361ADA5B